MDAPKRTLATSDKGGGQTLGSAYEKCCAYQDEELRDPGEQNEPRQLRIVRLMVPSTPEVAESSSP